MKGFWWELVSRAIQWRPNHSKKGYDDLNLVRFINMLALMLSSVSKWKSGKTDDYEVPGELGEQYRKVRLEEELLVSPEVAKKIEETRELIVLAHTHQTVKHVKVSLRDLIVSPNDKEEIQKTGGVVVFRNGPNMEHVRVPWGEQNVDPDILAGIERTELVVLLEETILLTAIFVILWGTKKCYEDIKDDILIPGGWLKKGYSRVDRALEVVEKAASIYGLDSVFVIGHSIGAAVALECGLDFARRAQYVETHLFNLPMVSFQDIVKLVGTMSSGSLWLASKVARRLGLNCQAQKLMNDVKRWYRRPDNLELQNIQNWFPHIYLNKYDHISKGTLSFFECCRSDDPCKPLSAVLHTNRRSPLSHKCHRMLQWEEAALDLEHKECPYNVDPKPYLRKA